MLLWFVCVCYADIKVTLQGWTTDPYQDATSQQAELGTYLLLSEQMH